MAKLKFGILGPISGKIGQVVGSSWMGIPYLREAPPKKKNHQTAYKKERTDNYLDLCICFVCFFDGVYDYI